MLTIPLAYAQPGMVLALPLYSPRGDLLLNQGVQLQPYMVDYLQHSGFAKVCVRDRETEDLEIKETISGRLRTKATSTVSRIFDTIEAAATEAPKQLDHIQALVRDSGFKQKLLSSPEFNDLPRTAEEVMNEALELDLLSSLGTLKSHDDYTFGHCVDVAVTAVVIGRELRFSKDQLRLLAQGAMLHDIGKVFIERAVLNKPSQLDADELQIMQHHPTLGFEMIREADMELLPKHVALQHHERQNGSGYPRGLTGTNRVAKSRQERDSSIALIGEVAAVADVYDALTSDRPYRPGLPPDQVAAILASMAGTHLNEEIVRKFLMVLEAFPVGLNVRIVEGRYHNHRGVVTESKPWRMDRPTVRLLSDANGARISPIDVDLEADDSMHLVSVDRV